jgi:hypothetical protein
MKGKCDDGTMRADSALNKLSDKVNEALRSIQPNSCPESPSIAFRVGDMLSRAGFINIRCTNIKLPMGHWPKVSNSVITSFPPPTPPRNRTNAGCRTNRKADSGLSVIV